MAASPGIVAAGHPATAAAAVEVLRAGGNAFDAVIAAFFAACVAEPVLASLGGGGFALVRPAGGRAKVYDFFVQTPRRKRAPEDCDFRPILADFGTAQQEFHIGYGAAATPGAVRGLFAIHRDLGQMPLPELLAPACALARDGVAVNSLQAYIFSVVAAIYLAYAPVRKLFESARAPGKPLQDGERLRMPELADLLEVLAREGEDLFYRGEVAAAIDRACREQGGHLRREDLRDYRVELRDPLQLEFRGARVLTNPPPSSGGLLIAFALDLLQPLDFDTDGFGSERHLVQLAKVMAATNRARLQHHLDEGTPPSAEQLLNPRLLARYRAEVQGLPLAPRGTTHVSVMDAAGSTAAMTVSNGEGCGHLLPGCGVMLNNMLGEEDLNPGGFHRWPEDRRMTSMMAPSLVLDQPRRRMLALGSGGSNRIRSAILQVLVNLLAFDLAVEEAVTAPRIHLENELLNVEAGFAESALAALRALPGELKPWPESNLFFGGAHTVEQSPRGFAGAGDPRRGGVCRIA